MKILIVDDSATMRKIVMRALRQAGFAGHEFEEAGNGREALESVEKQAPDLILSDWNMPEMSGIELLEALRARSIEVDLCFVTSEATAEMRKLATDAGAAGFITKPFTPDTMEAQLSGLIR